MELLVAVLVVGVGALGTAKLTMLSTQNNRAALEHSLATMFAADMLERIRANPQGSYGSALGDAPSGFVDCLSRSCSPPQLAAFDTAVWKCSLGRWLDEAPCGEARAAGALPARPQQAALRGGDGRVQIDAAGAVSVAVAWGASVAVLEGGR